MSGLKDDGDHPRPPFEDVLAALLKVDPTGIAGKQRKGAPVEENDEDA
jgi:hypothetical protein